jgi:hypothetical protein
MQVNLHKFGDSKLKDYMWLPGTHDSGMDHTSWKSFWANDQNTLTQSYGIGDQLLLGVRWFDLRPLLLDSVWYIAHAGTAGVMGWQGSTGPLLSEVIQEVNDFTSTHAELIVLRMTHILDAKTGAAVKDRFPELINTVFGGINNIYLGANGQSEYDLQNKPLRHFIGDGKAKVIVTGVPIDGAGFWETPDLEAVPARKTEFQVSQTYMTVELKTWQENAPIIGKDLRIEAGKLQDAEWKFTPQRLWTVEPGSNCSVLEIDNVYNMALLTICLAASFARRMRADRKLHGDIVIVYAGKLIDDPNVKNNVLQAARKNEFFKISDRDMGLEGRDPWYGERKACAVFVMEEKNGQPFARARFEWEGQEMDFSNNIETVTFDGRLLTGTQFAIAHYNIWRCMAHQHGIVPEGELFGVPEADKNRTIDVFYTYRSIGGEPLKQRHLQTGRWSAFKGDVKMLHFGGVTVPIPEVYEPFFWRLDYGGDKMHVNGKLMHEFDPFPGKIKELVAYLRMEEGEDIWKLSAWEGQDIKLPPLRQ